MERARYEAERAERQYKMGSARELREIGKFNQADHQLNWPWRLKQRVFSAGVREVG
jgi:hypothetical protein